MKIKRVLLNTAAWSTAAVVIGYLLYLNVLARADDLRDLRDTVFPPGSDSTCPFPFCTRKVSPPPVSTKYPDGFMDGCRDHGQVYRETRTVLNAWKFYEVYDIFFSRRTGEVVKICKGLPGMDADRKNSGALPFSSLRHGELSAVQRDQLSRFLADWDKQAEKRTQDEDCLRERLYYLQLTRELSSK